MGDRTSFQCHIYACPEDQRAAAAAVLAGLGIDWSSSAPGCEMTDETTPLNLTEAYTDDEISCGASDEYAANLIAAAPGCSFVLWEDPKYEWLGSVNAYTPELGHFSAECDANGSPVLFGPQITAMIDEAADLAALREAMARATGAAWFADWHGHDTDAPLTDDEGESAGCTCCQVHTWVGRNPDAECPECGHLFKRHNGGA